MIATGEAPKQTRMANRRLAAATIACETPGLRHSSSPHRQITAMDSLNDRFTVRKEDFDRPVLVTGSSGCIGSWALAILVRAGVPAVSFDLDASRRRPGPAPCRRKSWRR